MAIRNRHAFALASLALRGAGGGGEGGVLARALLNPNAAMASLNCGRLMRKAWLSGQAIP